MKFQQTKYQSYSLIFIRQNYNFDMLAMIWHEIVCWFLKIYQDLKRFAAQEHKIVFVLTFWCSKQFYVPNMQEQSKVIKKSEINRQTVVIWWLNSRRYRSVWYLFSYRIQIDLTDLPKCGTSLPPIPKALKWKSDKFSERDYCLTGRYVGRHVKVLGKRWA